MRNIILIIFISCIFIELTAQSHPSWSNYSYSFRVWDLDIHGNDIWVTTIGGGLVKYNKTTGNKIFYNRANANLPENKLLGLCYSDNGDIWVGGQNHGIGKFNGENCIIFNETDLGLPAIIDNTDIKEDNNGNIWFISYRWMVKYDGTEWKTWETGEDFYPSVWISGFDIDSENTVWIFSTDGIGKIENDEYSIINTTGSGAARGGCVKVDNDQNIWIAMRHDGLYKYDGNDFTYYSTLNSCLPTNSIYDISFDSDNKMWLATWDGLINFNISDYNIYQPQGADRSLIALKCDANDTIWCGTFNGKLLCFDGEDFTTSIELSNSPLGSNYITDIFVDSENNTWIGTNVNLVKKTDNQFIIVYNKYINVIEEDNEGDIWIAFNNGDISLIKLNGEESLVFDSLNSPFNTNYNPIGNIVFDLNNLLWIATSRNGLFSYDGITFTNYNTNNSSIPANGIFELVIDHNNSLWGGTTEGLFKFDGEDWKVWNTSNSDIPTNVIISLSVDSENKIWFSGMDESRRIAPELGGGLISFDGKHMTIYNIDNSELNSNTIFDTYIDDNDAVWITTFPYGIMCFNKNNPGWNKANPWTSYSVTNSGIAGNFTQVITGDKNGTIWIGHNDAGISVFNPDSSLQPVAINNEVYSSLTVFPNPASSELYIRLDLFPGTSARITIYDLSGRIIENIPESEIMYDNNSIKLNLDHSHYASQIYIISIITRNGLHYNSKFLYRK